MHRFADDERIDFFYSGGLFSILEDGNLLTADRVISYETVEGELYVASSEYAEVSDFEVAYSTSVLADTVVTITPSSGDEFVLIVSTEDGRDRDFVREFRRRMRQSKHP